MKNIVKSVLWFLAFAATMIYTSNLFAQEFEQSSELSTAGVRNEAFGTTAYVDAPDLSTSVAVGAVKPSLVAGKGSYATGGVALRNRGAGNISISGLVGAPRVTFIYWTVISLGAPPAPAKSIQIERLYPAPISGVGTLPGTVVGVGPAPCWGPKDAIITVFRATVPPAISVGNGSYQIRLLAGAAGLMDGSDPWIGAPALPLWDGASLVMVGTGVGTVSIYDSGLAGKTFAPNPAAFTYNLVLPFVPTGRRMLLDNIGADGQHVSTASRAALKSYSDETTTVNGFAIAGPGSDYNDSDWNGSSGLPVPELWDDTGHDITIASQNPAGAPAGMLNIVIDSALGPADCLTPVANIVEED